MNSPVRSFDCNHVRAFLATADEGSLSAAARALGLTQPTLSRQVAALEAELKERLAAWKPQVERPLNGYARMFFDHVEGAHTGADFDFLKGCRGSEVGRDSH